MNKIIHISTEMSCTPQRAFEMFTVNELLETWLTELADVEPRLGGKYELFWNPEDKDHDNTKGCKITAFVQDKLISFEWKGPKMYEYFMSDCDPLTHVSAFFLPGRNESGPSTEVHLIHSGWRDTPEWDDARKWFEKAWLQVFGKLKQSAVKS